MKCRRLLDRWERCQELPPREQVLLSAHLADCPACRVRTAAMDRAEAALRGLAGPVTAPDLLHDLRRRLAGAPARAPRRRWAVAMVPVAAAAAALLWIAHPAPTPPVRTADTRAITPLAARPPQVRADTGTQPVGVPPPRTVDHPQVKLVRSHPHPAPARVRFATVNRRTSTVSRLSFLATGPAEDAAFVAAEDEESTAGGVVILVGDPAPVLPSSQCFLEVSLSDGSTRTFEQNTDRDKAGRVIAASLTYHESPAAGAQPSAPGG
jgi:hypothetical protein